MKYVSVSDFYQKFGEPKVAAEIVNYVPGVQRPFRKLIWSEVTVITTRDATTGVEIVQSVEWKTT